jgi:hypothetical protein
MKLIAQLCALAPSSSLAARALNYKPAQMTASMACKTESMSSPMAERKPLKQLRTRPTTKTSE